MGASVGSYSWAVWKENQNGVSIAKSSLNGARRQLRKYDLCMSQPGKNLTSLPDKVIQNTCQKFKTLTGPLLKITHHSLFIGPLAQNNLWFLKDKYFPPYVRANHSSQQATLNSFMAFCLHKPQMLSLPWNTLSGLPESASPELQYSRPQPTMTTK